MNKAKVMQNCRCSPFHFLFIIGQLILYHRGRLVKAVFNPEFPNKDLNLS